jgi:hypothetical protein
MVQVYAASKLIIAELRNGPGGFDLKESNSIVKVRTGFHYDWSGDISSITSGSGALQPLCGQMLEHLWTAISYLEKLNCTNPAVEQLTQAYRNSKKVTASEDQLLSSHPGAIDNALKVIADYIVGNRNCITHLLYSEFSRKRM